MSNLVQKRNVNGILLLDKPLDMTSNASLQRVKRLFSAKKAGHTGSLDPKATGLLPICFGEATKFSQYLLESDKHYQVTVHLGIKTTTGDREGEIVARRSTAHITDEKIQTVLAGFKGAIQQIPPMFSAVKHEGRPLYELARQGIEIERSIRVIQIYSLNAFPLTEETFEMEVHCSKGTYIRTLVEDIGDALNCGAHVSALRRTAVASYTDASMFTMTELETLQQKDLTALDALLLPVETAVQSLSAVHLNPSSVFYLRTGQSIMSPNLPHSGLVRLYTEQGVFLGIGEVQVDGRLAPRRLIAA